MKILNIYLILLCTLATKLKANDLDKAELAFHNNQFFKSAAYYQGVIRQAKGINQKYLAADATTRLGENLRILGKEREAEGLLLRNEKQILKLPNHLLILAHNYDVLGELRYYISDIERAGSYFKKSLAIKKLLLKENDADLAFSYSNIGRYYNYTQQKDSAIILTQRAYQIINSKPINDNHIIFERIYEEYAYALKEEQVGRKSTKRYDDVIRPILFEALKYNNRNYSKPNFWSATIYHSIGNTYTDELDTLMLTEGLISKQQRLQCYKTALKYYSKARGIFKSITPEMNPRLSMTFFVTGLAYTYYGAAPRLTLKALQQAIHQVIPQTDTTNYLTLPDGHKTPYNIHHYLSLISFKIDALNLLAKGSKANNIYNRAILVHTDYLIKIWGELIKSYKLNDNRDITTYYFRPPYGDALDACISLYTTTKNIKYIEKALFYIELSKYSSGFFQQKIITDSNIDLFLKSARTQSLKLSKIKQKLSRDEAIWDIYDGIHSFYTLTITKEKVELSRIAISKFDKQNFSLLTKANTLSTTEYKRLAYQTFLKFGFNNHIFYQIRNINIIPGITYSYSIPFSGLIATLKGDNFKTLDYLIYKYKFHYSLSTLISLQNAERDINVNNFQILYASPPNLSSLPFTKRLVNQLNSTYKVSIINGSQPVNSILSGFNHRGIVHIAAHSIINQSNSGLSFIALNGKKIFITEIYKYQMHANLINLASCETTIGKTDEDNGSVVNFVRAFTYAGANSITSTLWKVDDEMTSKIYSDFYSELYHCQDKANALNAAQIKYINKASIDAANPYYWAGIILFGDTKPISILHK